MSGVPQGFLCDSDLLTLNRCQKRSTAMCRKSGWHVAVKDARARAPQPPHPLLTEGLGSVEAGGPCALWGHTPDPERALVPRLGDTGGPHRHLVPPGLAATTGDHLEAGLAAWSLQRWIVNSVFKILNSVPLLKHHSEAHDGPLCKMEDYLAILPLTLVN